MDDIDESFSDIPTPQERNELLKTKAHKAVEDAEKAWHAYASDCEVGEARTRAFQVFENVRCSRRIL